jgi:hypothetical protein
VRKKEGKKLNIPAGCGCSYLPCQYPGKLGKGHQKSEAKLGPRTRTHLRKKLEQDKKNKKKLDIIRSSNERKI